MWQLCMAGRVEFAEIALPPPADIDIKLMLMRCIISCGSLKPWQTWLQNPRCMASPGFAARTGGWYWLTSEPSANLPHWLAQKRELAV